MPKPTPPDEPKGLLSKVASRVLSRLTGKAKDVAPGPSKASVKDSSSEKTKAAAPAEPKSAKPAGGKASSRAAKGAKAPAVPAKPATAPSAASSPSPSKAAPPKTATSKPASKPSPKPAPVASPPLVPAVPFAGAAKAAKEGRRSGAAAAAQAPHSPTRPPIEAPAAGSVAAASGTPSLEDRTANLPRPLFGGVSSPMAPWGEPSSPTLRAFHALPSSHSFTSEAILARFEMEPPHAEGEEPRLGPPEDWGLEIPSEYGQTRLTLLVRDPEWVYAFWEINDADRMRFGLPRGRRDRKLVLRLYDKTPGVGGAFVDLALDPDANNWYVRLAPQRRWMADLGFYDELGRFVTIASSNLIDTPRDQPSDDVGADEWMIVEEDFEAIFAASGGTYATTAQIGSEFVSQTGTIPGRKSSVLTFALGASRLP